MLLTRQEKLKLAQNLNRFEPHLERVFAMPPVRFLKFLRCSFLTALMLGTASLAYSATPVLIAGDSSIENDDSNTQPSTIETPQQAAPSQPTTEPESPEAEEDTVLV
jgi:hypothetical protein